MKVIVISLLIFTVSCIPNKASNGVNNTNGKSVQFKNGHYEVKKMKDGQIKSDTSWYYSDSTLKNLQTITTSVKKGDKYETNQIINFNKEGDIDYNRSIFYQIDRGNTFNISYFSKYKDSVCLVLGTYDKTYSLAQKSDTFYLTSENIVLPIKSYYKRGKLCIYRKKDSTYSGMELFISPKELGWE